MVRRQKPTGERNSIRRGGLVRTQRVISDASASSSQLTPPFQYETSLSSIQEDEISAAVPLERARELVIMMPENKRRRLRNDIDEYSLAPHTTVKLKDEHGSELPVSVEHFLHLCSTIDFESAVVSREQAEEIVRMLRDGHRRRILATIEENFMGTRINIILLTNPAGVQVPVAVSDFLHFARLASASSSIDRDHSSAMPVPQPLFEAYINQINRHTPSTEAVNPPSYGGRNAYRNQQFHDEDPSPPHGVPQVAISISSKEDHYYRPGLLDALVMCCCCGWLTSTFGKRTAKNLLLVTTSFTVCLCVIGVVAVMVAVLTDGKNKNELPTTISTQIADTTTANIMTTTDHNSSANTTLPTNFSSATSLSTEATSLSTTNITVTSSTTLKPFPTTKFTSGTVTTTKTQATSKATTTRTTTFHLSSTLKPLTTISTSVVRTTPIRT